MSSSLTPSKSTASFAPAASPVSAPVAHGEELLLLPSHGSSAMPMAPLDNVCINRWAASCSAFCCGRVRRRHPLQQKLCALPSVIYLLDGNPATFLAVSGIGGPLGLDHSHMPVFCLLHFIVASSTAASGVPIKQDVRCHQEGTLHRANVCQNDRRRNAYDNNNEYKAMHTADRKSSRAQPTDYLPPVFHLQANSFTQQITRGKREQHNY